MKKINQLMAFSFILGSVSICSFSCASSGPVSLQSIKIDVTSPNPSPVVMLNKTTSQPLKVVYTPDNATNKNITWSIADTSIAKVDAKTGLITGLKIGQTTITAVSEENANIKDSCTLSVIQPDDWEILHVNKNKLLVDFETNRSVSEGDEAFIDGTVPYTIGTDNPLNFRPSLEIYDENGVKISDTEWTYDYEITVEIYDSTKQKYVVVDNTYYTVTDARQGTIQFKEKAAENINDKFKVTIMPGGLDDEQKADPNFRQVNEVRVVKGYNITTANELSLFDTRVQGDNDTAGGRDCTNTREWYPYHADFTYKKPEYEQWGYGLFDTKWYEWKQEHNIPTPENFHSDNFVIHGNIQITKDNIPSTFFYTENEFPEGTTPEEKARSVGSLKDPMFIYHRHTENETKIYGNYFKLSLQNIKTPDTDFPLITRENGWESGSAPHTDVDRVDSHSALFYITKGDFSISEVNSSGNFHSEVDPQYLLKQSGSIIFAKTTQWVNNITFNNCITRKYYMTSLFDNEGGASPNITTTSCKFFDHYNCFLYNLGGLVKASDCIFKRAGGPAIIQDHVSDGFRDSSRPDYDPVIAGETYTVEGAVAKTVYKNCEVDNLCTGQEGWFVSFGAVAAIEQLNNLAAALTTISKEETSTSTTGYSFKTNKDGAYVDPTKTTDTTYFNFSGISKNNGLTGAGTNTGIAPIMFLDEEGEIENFLNYMYWKDDPTFVDNQPADSVLFENYRALRSSSAPIFQTKGGLAYFNGSTIIDVSTGTDLKHDSNFFKQSNGIIGIYFMGILISFGFGQFGSASK